MVNALHFHDNLVQYGQARPALEPRIVSTPFFETRFTWRRESNDLPALRSRVIFQAGFRCPALPRTPSKNRGVSTLALAQAMKEKNRRAITSRFRLAGASVIAQKAQRRESVRSQIDMVARLRKAGDVRRVSEEPGGSRKAYT